MTADLLQKAHLAFKRAIWIDIVVCAIVAATKLVALGTLHEIQSGIAQPDADLVSRLEFWESFSLVSVMTMVAVGLFLINWLGACYDFARSKLGVTTFKQEGWKTIGWILPLANLFKPYQVIREIYRLGSTNTDGKAEDDTPPQLLAWWLFWAASHFAFWIAGKHVLRSTLRDDMTLSQVIGITGVQLGIFITSVIVSTAWLYVSTLLTTRLYRRAGMRGPDPSVGLISKEEKPIASDVQSSEHSRLAVLEAAPISTYATPDIAVAGSDEHIYERIAQELDTDAQRKGLWLKCYANAAGDATKQRLLYIEERHAEIATEMREQHQAARREQLAKQRDELMNSLAGKYYGDSPISEDELRTLARLFEMEGLLNERRRNADTMLHVCAKLGWSQLYHDILNAGASEEVGDASGKRAWEYMSRCPSCGIKLSLMALACTDCNATFEGEEAWKPIPLTQPSST
jgi:Domain of unknown function (DUF4328)